MSKAEAIQKFSVLVENLPDSKINQLFEVLEKEANANSESWESAIQAIFQKHDGLMKRLAQ